MIFTTKLWRLVTRPTCNIISNGLLQKAIEMETACFHSLRNPKGRTLDHYASHIRHNFPYKLIPISMS